MIQLCELCGGGDSDGMLLCDSCNGGYHYYCLNPPLKQIPESDWFCHKCITENDGGYGFGDGQTHSLASFQQLADEFKANWFKRRDGKEITESDVEREFWHLIESPYSDVEVEYGADLHSSHHGRLV
jgi:histone demethylase JARID1